MKARPSYCYAFAPTVSSFGAARAVKHAGSSGALKARQAWKVGEKTVNGLADFVKWSFKNVQH